MFHECVFNLLVVGQDSAGIAVRQRDQGSTKHGNPEINQRQYAADAMFAFCQEIDLLKA